MTRHNKTTILPMHHIVFKNVSLPSVVYTITILLRRRRRVSAHDDNSPFSFELERGP